MIQNLGYIPTFRFRKAERVPEKHLDTVLVHKAFFKFVLTIFNKIFACLVDQTGSWVDTIYTTQHDK